MTEETVLVPCIYQYLPTRLRGLSSNLQISLLVEELDRVVEPMSETERRRFLVTLRDRITTRLAQGRW